MGASKALAMTLYFLLGLFFALATIYTIVNPHLEINNFGRCAFSIFFFVFAIGFKYSAMKMFKER